MSTKQKKRLCWNCEGRVSVQQENCPYCGVYLSPLDEEGKDNNALFAPPYKIVEEEPISHSPYAPRDIMHEERRESVEETLSLQKSEEVLSNYEGIHSILIPLSCLIAGAVLLLFSLALVLFSRKGYLTLQWDGSYWSLYLSTALILLAIGGYFLNKLEK